jgi:hypothetical protein
MLFHLTHVHTPESCPSHNPEGMKKMAQLMKSAEERGVRIHGMWTCTWQHTIYGVIEAESADALEAWTEPALEIGQATITPVTDAVATLKRLTGGGQ